MLTVLLESRAIRQRRVGGTVLSVVTHGAVIAVVVALTLPHRGVAKLTPDVRPAIVHYVPTSPPETHSNAAPRQSPAAPDRSAARSDLPRIEVPVVTPTTIPPIDLTQPSLTSDQVLIGGRSNPFTPGIGGPGAQVDGTGGVSDASVVDRVPRLIGRAAEPRYPAALRSAGIQGHVLAEFVVDTLGHAELATLRFPELAHPLFGDAVRDALERYRFLPGEVAGRKVRTRVAVPFEFRLEK
jgi:periplasmic protein TonB